MSFRLPYMILLFFAWQSLTSVWAYEEGLASYYHNRLHGRASSSGRIHDRDELVAAHRTHPFGTFLRVTNLENMKSVIVCVTDRGPHKKGRIIDVSIGAAELLNFVKKGVARVRVEVVPGSLDLRYLELIYPKIPYLKIDYLQPKLPYRMLYKK